MHVNLPEHCKPYELLEIQYFWQNLRGNVIYVQLGLRKAARVI